MDISSKVFLLFGPTRYGKSTFINNIYGEEITPAGVITSDHSTTMICREILTNRPNLCNGQNLYFIDVMGIKDTNWGKTDEEIVEVIRDFVLNFAMQIRITHLDGVIVFQSLQESQSEVGHAMILLKTLFGDDINRSVQVLMTKEDVMKMHPSLEQLLPSRIELVQNYCSTENISLMKWANYNGISFANGQRSLIPLPPNMLNQQIVDLSASLQMLQPLPLSNIEERLAEIEHRAIEIYEGQDFSYVTRQIEVDHQVLEEVTEDVQRTQYVPGTQTSAQIEVRAKEIQQMIGQIQSTEVVTVRLPKTLVYYDSVTREVKTPYKKRGKARKGWKKVTRYHTSYVTDYIRREETVLADEQQFQTIMKLLDIGECRHMAAQETHYVAMTITEKQTKLRVRDTKRRLDIQIPVPALTMERCYQIAVKEIRDRLDVQNSLGQFHGSN
jgi:hypothetical protein